MAVHLNRSDEVQADGDRVREAAVLYSGPVRDMMLVFADARDRSAASERAIEEGPVG